MSETTAAAHAREMMTIWEEAICYNSMRSLLPPDLARAREHLEKLNGEANARNLPDQLFFYYRVCTIIIHHTEPPTMRQFSEQLALPLSSATRVADWLVHAGYLARQTDPDDRRLVRVTLTENGLALYKMINTHMRQRMEALLRQFTIQERKDLLVLSHKLVQAIKNLSC